MSRQYVSQIANMDMPSNIRGIGGGGKLKTAQQSEVDSLKEQFSDRMARQGEEHMNRSKSTFVEPAAPEYYRSQSVLDSQTAQGIYPSYLTGESPPNKEATDYLAGRSFEWDLLSQKNVSLGVFLVEEAEEYLELLMKDTHNQLSNTKDYAGLASGMRGAYDVAKDLGAFGAIAKAVYINGKSHIVIENYKPRYLDIGPRWQASNPKMLKMGYALNTLKGNVSYIKGNVFVEVVFSGAVNAVDYMLHDEKTLGEVVGQFSTDVAKGIATGLLAQGLTVAIATVAGSVLVIPTAVTLGVFAFSCFLIGGLISDLDKQYEYTAPLKAKVEDLVNGF